MDFLKNLAEAKEQAEKHCKDLDNYIEQHGLKPFIDHLKEKNIANLSEVMRVTIDVCKVMTELEPAIGKCKPGDFKIQNATATLRAYKACTSHIVDFANILKKVTDKAVETAIPIKN